MYTKALLKNNLPEEELEDRMKKLFMEIMQRNGGEQFCTKDEMMEFYNDGLKIIDFFKRKRADYFSKKGYELLGIETALNYDLPNNLKFKGFIDLIIKDNIRNQSRLLILKHHHGVKQIRDKINRPTPIVQIILFKTTRCFVG